MRYMRVELCNMAKRLLKPVYHLVKGPDHYLDLFIVISGLDSLAEVLVRDLFGYTSNFNYRLYQPVRKILADQDSEYKHNRNAKK